MIQIKLQTQIINIISGLGYGIALTSLPVEIVEKYAQIVHFDPSNPIILSTLEVGLCVGAALGCLLTPLITKIIGVARSLRIMFFVLAVVSLGCMFPVHWVYLAVFRLIQGFFTFSIGSISPLLVAENLDPKQRGIAIILYTICVNTGITSGYFVHWAISYNYNLWVFTFAGSTLCGVIGGITSIFLVRNLAKSDKKQYEQMTENESYISQSKLTRYQIVRLVVITTAVASLQVITGIDSYVIYASHMLKSVFDNSRAGIFGSIIFGVSFVICCVGAAKFIEKYKRRTMMLIGTVGCGVTNLLMAVSSLLHGPEYLNLVLLVVFLLFYNLGPEAVVYLLFAEMFPEKYKIVLNGYGYGINWSVNILTVFIFDFFQGEKLWIVFCLYGVLTLLCGVTGVILAPETLQRQLLDIEGEIRRWQSKSERMARTKREMRPVIKVADVQNIDNDVTDTMTTTDQPIGNLD